MFIETEQIVQKLKFYYCYNGHLNSLIKTNVTINILNGG